MTAYWFLYGKGRFICTDVSREFYICCSDTVLRFEVADVLGCSQFYLTASGQSCIFP